jgi:hypothetical protein
VEVFHQDILHKPSAVRKWWENRLEPPGQISEGDLSPKVKPEEEKDNPLPAPLKSGQPGEDLAKVVLAWGNLSQTLRAAVLTLVDAGKEGQP